MKTGSKKIFIPSILILTIILTVVVLQRMQNLRGEAQEFDRIEAENAIASGNINVATDTTASGGKYVTMRKSPLITGKTYYLDCTDGNDNNTGLEVNSAWKSLSKISQASLVPGDGIMLKKGSICTGTLSLPWNGTSDKTITLSSYGTGELPVIQSNVNNARLVSVSGSYITIQDLSVVGIAPSLEVGCNNNPKGYIIGFQLSDSSHHITIKNSKASGNYAGVYIMSGSYNNIIVSNSFTNNTMMNPLDVGGGGDAGAFGVLIHGNDNEISHNTFTGQDACSYDYGRDGSAVEIYGGSRNIIHHNIASQNDHFSELGKNSAQSSSDNVFAYNKFTSTLQNSVFINTRGTGQSYGPIYRTKVYNNSVYLTGSQSQGVVCSGCGSDILTLKNNILWANWKAIYASTAFIESNNIYWKTGGSPLIQGFTPSGTSKIIDPRYTNAGGGDLHAQSTSPAINSGSNESVTAGFTSDLDGTTVPLNGTVDIGAYEQ